MEMKPLSKEEIQILYALEKNASLSCFELAEKLCLDENLVKSIKEQLENEGIIVKYKAFINWELLEVAEVDALIEINVQPKEGYGYDHIAAEICAYREVYSCILVSGSFDLLVQVRGASLKDVSFFVAEKLAVLSSITQLSTSFLLKRYKQWGDTLNCSKKTRRLPIVI